MFVFQIVGLPAKQQKLRNTSNTICQVKQILGRSWEDKQVQGQIANSAVEVSKRCSRLEQLGRFITSIAYYVIS